MACSGNNYGILNGACGTTASAPGTPSLAGPHLIVSNCPETVNAAALFTKVVDGVATNTLYRAELALPAGTTRIRVFIWHLNNMGGNRVFSLFGRLVSGSGTVSDKRVTAQVTNNYPPLGLCLAKVHLWGE